MRKAPPDTLWFRVLACAAVGIGAGLAGGTLTHAAWAPMLGWVATAVTFCGWTWLRIRGLDADAARSHATLEDAGRATADALLLLASLAALVGVGLLLAAHRDAREATADALVGVAGVVAAWFVVHTLFTLRYARLHFAHGEGIDFGDEPPTYHDFAYVAFTIGMTYQVSDTTLQAREIRHTAMRHALLSFLLGAVVLACTINLVVQLASGQ